MEERKRRSFKIHVNTCPMCGMLWRSAKSNVLTCSPRCRQRLSRANRATAAAAAAAAAKKKKKRQPAVTKRDAKKTSQAGKKTGH